MRVRLLKPGFFTNDDLGELPMAARLLFAGLWCLADREGRLLDKPKRIKVQVLPYDDVDAHELLGALAEAGFITRYTADGEGYIHITHFLQHQRPHQNESPSDIPAPPDDSQTSDNGRSPSTIGRSPSTIGRSPSDIGVTTRAVFNTVSIPVTGIRNTEEDAEYVAPPAASPLGVLPTIAEEFSRTLEGTTGYERDERFLLKVVAVYGPAGERLALDREAIIMRDWLKDAKPIKGKPRQASQGFILGWLKRESERQRNGPPLVRGATNGAGAPTFTDAEKYRKGIKHV